MIWAVGVVLCFQTKTAAMNVAFAGFALQTSVQKVPAVELNAGFLSSDLEGASCRWLVHGCRQRHFFVAPAVAPIEDPVVIVPAAEGQLFVVLSDVTSDRFRLS